MKEILMLFKKYFHLLLFFGIGVSLPFHTRYIFGYTADIKAFFEYGSMSVYSIDILLPLLLFFLLLQGDICESLQSLCTKIKKSKAWIYFCVLMIFLFLQLLWISYPLLHIRFIISVFEILILIFLLMSKKQYTLYFALGCISGLSIQNFFALHQFFAQYIAPHTWLGIAEQKPEILGTSVIEMQGHRFLRAYGLSPHPNILGGMAVLSVLLLTIFKTYWKERLASLSSFFQNYFLREFLFIALFFLSSFAVLISFSRSAWIALVLAFLAFIILWRKELKEHWDIFVGILLAVLLFWSLLGGNIVSRFDQTQRLEQKSTHTRLENYVEWSEQSKDGESFMFGEGLQNYTAQLKEGDKTKRALWEYQPVHSVPLLLFSELGVLGATLLILFFWKLWKEKKREKEHIFIIVPIFFLLLFDHYWWTNLPAFFMLMLVLFLLYTSRSQLK